MSDYIRISKTCARWMVSLGATLVNEAYGTNWDPMRSPVSVINEDEVDFGMGFMDEMPQGNHPMIYWADALIRFVRTMAAIAAHELIEDQENNLLE